LQDQFIQSKKQFGLEKYLLKFLKQKGVWMSKLRTCKRSAGDNGWDFKILSVLGNRRMTTFSFVQGGDSWR
jgi:hypothetical protein